MMKIELKNERRFWTIEEAVPIWKAKYKVKFGRNQVYNILKLLGVLDYNNESLPPYSEQRYFEDNRIDVHSRYKKVYVTEHNKIKLSKRGLVFIGRLLQANKDISLKRPTKFMGDPIDPVYPRRSHSDDSQWM